MAAAAVAALVAGRAAEAEEPAEEVEVAGEGLALVWGFMEGVASFLGVE